MAEQLALHGGTAVRSALLPYSRQSVDEVDLEAVVGVLRSDWLTTGPLGDTFERAVALAVGAAHGIAVSSGTAALHAAVWAAGIRPGDEVVTSPLAFVASTNAIVYCGGVPVFADVQPDTLNIDPSDVAARMTSRTRAVLPVDFAGQPAALDEIEQIASAKELLVIEDAAHALGAEHRSRRVGGIADLTTFSFHPAKLVTSGEGGIVTTQRADLAARVRRFRNHGFNIDFREREVAGESHSSMVDLGYNYRLTDLQCALGLSQLGKLDQFLKRRAEIAHRYTVALEEFPWLEVPRAESHVCHAWHIYCVRLNLERLCTDRQTVVAALRAENIGVAVHYVPVYWHPYYEALGYRRGLCPRAEAAFERLLTLPLFPAMTDADVDDVVAALRKVLGSYGR